MEGVGKVDESQGVTLASQTVMSTGDCLARRSRVHGDVGPGVAWSCMDVARCGEICNTEELNS